MAGLFLIRQEKRARERERVYIKGLEFSKSLLVALGKCYGHCCKFLYTNFSYKIHNYAYSADPDQTAPAGAV